MKRLLVTGSVLLVGLTLYFAFRPAPQSISKTPTAPSPTQKLGKEDLELAYKTLIADAQELIKNDQLAKAMSTVEGFPINTVSFPAAQKIRTLCANELLTRAWIKYRAADITTALSMLDAIPDDRDAYSKARQLSVDWTEHNKILKTAFSAESSGQWVAVLDAIETLRIDAPDLYRSPRVQGMIALAKSQIQPASIPVIQSGAIDSGDSNYPPTPAPSAFEESLGTAPFSPSTPPVAQRTVAQPPELAQPPEPEKIEPESVGDRTSTPPVEKNPPAPAFLPPPITQSGACHAAACDFASPL